MQLTSIETPYRYATIADSHAIAELVNIAGEGLPLYYWEKISTGDQSAWEIGRERAQRESSDFSYRNTIVQIYEREVIACLIGYPLAENPEPIDYTELPPMFVPLQELENMAPNTWYVNVLAVYEHFRNKGYGSAMLELAEKVAIANKRNSLSIIVSDANTGAWRLYEKSGYQQVASRPMVKEGWINPGENWVLLRKDLN